MKRSPFLQPLSREHHTALSLAKACTRASGSADPGQVRQACERALREYAQDLDRHFEIEERTLLPLLQAAHTQPLVVRTLTDHQTLRGLLDALHRNDTQALGRFGQCLTEHVRFEERELFPAIEGLL